jgi:two-component system LytT family response regulator
VLVADDEPLARGMVANLLKGDPEIESVLECGDAASARAGIARQRPDIAFLDISAGATGLQLAGELPDAGRSSCSSRPSAYAPQAFDVSATDYVLKPFSDERFREALERAKRRVRERRSAHSRIRSRRCQPARARWEPAEPGRGCSGLSPAHRLQGRRSVCGDQSRRDRLDRGGGLLRAVHSKQGRHLVRTTLASLERRLDPQRFVRVHRTAIVNVEEVRVIRDSGQLRLTLSDGAEVAVSRSRRSHVEPFVRPRLR